LFESIQPKLENLIETAQSTIRDFRSRIISWYKLGIIVSVLLLSTTFALFGTQQLAQYLLLAIIAIGGVLVLLINPHLGLIALVIGAFFVPSPISIVNTAILMVGFLSFLWIVDMFVRKRQIKLVPSITMIPAFAFIIISFIAFLNSQLIYTSLARTAPITTQLGGLGVFILSIAAFILTANQIKDLIWLERLTWVFIALATIYVIFGGIAPHAVVSLVRPLYQYGSADTSIFWIWIVAITSSQAFYNQSLKIHWRLLLLGILGATIYLSFFLAYSWKSGWLPPLIGLGTIFWFGTKKLRLPVILIGFLVVVFSSSNFSGFVTGGEDYSLQTRFPAWSIVLEIFKLNPILGVGIANYYWYTPIFRILGYTGLTFSSHNNYIDLLAQMGIVGLLCFLWFFWAIGRLNFQLKDRVPPGFASAYVLGAIGGLVATLTAGMLGDWIMPFVYNVGLPGFRSSMYSFIFLGGLVYLEQIYINNVGQKHVKE
jgi:O-antigen ligase